MPFQIVRTKTRPSSDINFYFINNRIIEEAVDQLGAKHISSKVETIGNTQKVTRVFVDEDAYQEFMNIITSNVDHEATIQARDQYDNENGIISEVVTSTIP